MVPAVVGRSRRAARSTEGRAPHRARLRDLRARQLFAIPIAIVLTSITIAAAVLVAGLVA